MNLLHTTPLIICLMVSGAVSVTAGAPVTRPATTQNASQTRYAYRKVEAPVGKYGLTWDPDISSMLDQNAVSMAEKFFGAGVNVMGDNGGPNRPYTPPWFLSTPLSTGDVVEFELIMRIPPNAPPVASEFLDAVIAKTEEQVRPLYENARAKPLKDATRALANSQQRYHQASDELRELRDKLRASAGRVDVSPQSIADALSKLEEEKQKLELDVMGKQARRDALDQQIAKQSQTIQKNVEDDAIAAELQKVVDARQEKVKEMKAMVRSGQATPAMISDSVAAAADAQAKLLQRRHDAAAEAGGDALQAFNREAVTLSVDLSEAKARLKFIDDRLSHLASASDQIDRLERAQAQEQSAAAEVDKRTKALHDLQEKIASLPPGELTVISSQNSATPPDNGG
jgi:hypothetical protein